MQLAVHIHHFFPTTARDYCGWPACHSDLSQRGEFESPTTSDTKKQRSLLIRIIHTNIDYDWLINLQCFR